MTQIERTALNEELWMLPHEQRDKALVNFGAWAWGYFRNCEDWMAQNNNTVCQAMADEIQLAKNGKTPQ